MAVDHCLSIKLEQNETDSKNKYIGINLKKAWKVTRFFRVHPNTIVLLFIENYFYG